MLSSSRPVLFTLLFTLTLLILLAPAADASSSSPVHRRQANRMVRKRASTPALAVVSVGADPANPTSADTAIAATATATATTSSSATTNAHSITVSSSTSSVTGTSTSTDPIVETATTASSSSATSSSETSSSTASSTSTLSSPPTSSSSTLSTTSSSQTTSSSSSSTSRSTTEVLQVTQAPDTTTSSSPISPQQSTQTVTNTLSSDSSAATESASVQSATSSSVSKTTITIIIVIAASVGGMAIIWTIIRKWKFRPSAEFEDRMQPIDWTPSMSHSDSLHRTASNASHGSFHSGSESGMRPHGNGNPGLVSDLPSHDFTAGPAHLGGNYADLTRGPSPMPQMSQAVSRGQSVNRGGYGY